jgi:beta-lactamase class A
MSSWPEFLSSDDLARVSIALLDADGVTRFEHRQNVKCYAASIMKLAVAVAVLRELDRGVLSPDDVLAYDGGFASDLDRSWFTIDDDSVDLELFATEEGGAAEEFPSHWVRKDAPAGRVAIGITVARALRRSITVSSNEAANLLMQIVGFESINLVFLEAGCENSVVERMVFDTPARDVGRTNRLTALDAAQLMWGIRFGTIASAEALDYLCGVLRAQTQRSMIPFALADAGETGETGAPGAPGAPGETGGIGEAGGSAGACGVVVGNKEGQTKEVLHDVAFIEPDDTDPFVLAVCTVGLGEEEATTVVRKIATYAYESRSLWKSLTANFQ